MNLPSPNPGSTADYTEIAKQTYMINTQCINY